MEGVGVGVGGDQKVLMACVHVTDAKKRLFCLYCERFTVYKCR